MVNESCKHYLTKSISICSLIFVMFSSGACENNEERDNKFDNLSTLYKEQLNHIRQRPLYIKKKAFDLNIDTTALTTLENDINSVANILAKIDYFPDCNAQSYDEAYECYQSGEFEKVHYSIEYSLDSLYKANQMDKPVVGLLNQIEWSDVFGRTDIREIIFIKIRQSKLILNFLEQKERSLVNQYKSEFKKIEFYPFEFNLLNDNLIAGQEINMMIRYYQLNNLKASFDSLGVFYGNQPIAFETKFYGAAIQMKFIALQKGKYKIKAKAITSYPDYPEYDKVDYFTKDIYIKSDK
ncbi:hypothetical protein [Aureibacter tunicatorum]|uniref:Uncharacterized protein n=1 Tax=Aureibacter tunicatorum TaxID=866807 RepID=A0AAE4BRF8_9BACT|nr:hypothetical protein [Aureibacter tunicatorum]MDR6237898.1 hypothetical protein [Aureibacter tunicatorum]BDD02931.1 hypothetical protein AUTU_04140 [Aureibacter tunicatorum]